MSGTFPSSPAPRRVRFRSHQPARVSVAHSLKRQSRTRNAQRWGLSLEFPGMDRVDFAPIFAFVVSQRGPFDTFQYVLPAPLHTPQGVGAVGSPNPYVDNTTTSPTENQTGRSIITLGWPASVTVLKAMDFFKFGSHSKVYMAREDVASDGSGRATIPMEPAALQSLADGEGIQTHSLPFTVALTEEQQEFLLEVDPEFGFSLDLVEAF
ncbi:MAG: hypothetical protein U1A72_19245 [Sulfuritalea sp.]|nr:hypothetical protein [Sulfuritalea sp.]